MAAFGVALATAMNTSPLVPYRSTRVQPRLKFATPVQVQVGASSFLCNSEDISVGGLRARHSQPPPPLTQLRLQFNLPSGTAVNTEAIVRYARADRFGAQFLGLANGAHVALHEYVRRTLGYTRRGNRVVKRFTVTLRSTVSGLGDELAETVVLSRNGGRLICRVRFKIGEELRLYWPRQNRATQVRVVFRRLGGVGEFTEVGFEFLGEDDFWQIQGLS